jgi:hypothetical protein
MAVVSSKIYEIELTTTGSDVNPTDILVLQLSGSANANFINTSISDTVVNWQEGQEISGSDMLSQYNLLTITENNLTASPTSTGTSIGGPFTTATANFSGTSIILPTGELLQNRTEDEFILDGFKEFSQIKGKYARIQFDYTISAYDESLAGVYAVGFNIGIPMTPAIEVVGRNPEDPNPIVGSVDTGYIFIPLSSTPRISISIFAPQGGLVVGDFHQSAIITNISVLYKDDDVLTARLFNTSGVCEDVASNEFLF